MSYPDIRPAEGDYNKFYEGYINLVRDRNLLEALEYSDAYVHKMIHQLGEEHGDFRYDIGKWSVKEVIMHMMDAERVFAYRAMRFSRNDLKELPGFDENDYAPESNANALSVAQLADFLTNLRSSTTDLFSSFSQPMLERRGLVEGNVHTVLAIGYIIAGHTVHHGNILEEKYLSKLQ